MKTLKKCFCRYEMIKYTQFKQKEFQKFELQTIFYTFKIVFLYLIKFYFIKTKNYFERNVQKCHVVMKFPKKGAYFVHFFSKNCRVLVNDDRSSKSVAFSWFCRVLVCRVIVSTTVFENSTSITNKLGCIILNLWI